MCLFMHLCMCKHLYLRDLPLIKRNSFLNNFRMQTLWGNGLVGTLEVECVSTKIKCDVDFGTAL